MSLKNGEMHAVSVFGALALTVAIGAPTLWLTANKGVAEAAPLEEMEAIEASIAYKKKPAKQPQKKVVAPPPEVKVEGVSRDETKVPEPKKDDKKDPPKATPTDKPVKPAIPDRADPDEPTGKPTTSIGEFDPNARPGFAEETKGDPYFQRLAGDFHDVFKYPGILEGASAVGCLHIQADGKIAKTKIDQKSGTDTLDDALERALKDLVKLRDAKPEPVPTYLLAQATTRWICFRTKQQQRE